MRSRILTITLVSMLLALIGPTAFAQETKPSSEPVVTGTVEPYYGELQVTNSSVTVKGKAADTAPAGSDFTLVLTIGNSSDKAARNISMKIDAIPSYITLTDTSPAVSDLAAGDSTTVTVDAHAGETGCEDFASFGATFDSSLGKTQTKFGIQVACPGARLSVETVEYRGGDGDGVPEPGERIQIFVTLRNTGRDPATGVHATMKVDSKDITLVDSTSAWQDIPGGGTLVAASPFVIDIAADAKTQGSSCSGIGGGPMPVETAPPPSGGSGSSGSGQSEPGATGSGDTVTATPADSSQPAPTQVEPAPPAPDQTVDPSATPEPAPDNPVAFDATLSVAASGQTFDGAFSTQTACMYAGMEKGGPNPVPPTDNSGGSVPTAARQEKLATSGPGRAPLISLAIVLLLGAMTAVLRRKFSPNV